MPKGERPVLPAPALPPATKTYERRQGKWRRPIPLGGRRIAERPGAELSEEDRRRGKLPRRRPPMPNWPAWRATPTAPSGRAVRGSRTAGDPRGLLLSPPAPRVVDNRHLRPRRCRRDRYTHKKRNFPPKPQEPHRHGPSRGTSSAS